MPGEHPDPDHSLRLSNCSGLDTAHSTCDQSHGRFSLFPKISRNRLRCTVRSLMASSAIYFSMPGIAQALEGVAPAAGGFLNRFMESFGSASILMLAVFGGAMSFALLSASWLIRERKRIAGENQALLGTVADFRARNDLIETLVNVSDQRTVVWGNSEDKPVIMGSLADVPGIPEDRKAFLAFGKWLEPDSAARFDTSLQDLRRDASNFDLTLKTKSGKVLEAKGRTSGSSAFVRFQLLEGVRSELANLKHEHSDLLATFGTIQALFEKLPMPFWLRNPQGGLVWANAAFVSAVEAGDMDEAVRDNAQLLDQEHRREIEAVHEDAGFFSGLRPAVVAGDRRMMDIYSAASETGIAGIAVDQNEIETVRATLSETIEGHSRMLDQLATAVAIFDSRQRLTFFNSGFQQMWKLDAAQLENEPTNGELLDAMRDQQMLPVQPDWRKWREGQLEIYTALEPVEDWWHLPDGQTLRVVVSPRNEGGATWIFENVTERLALESNYNALMRVQGETLDHLGEGVAVFGSDGKLKLFNPALANIWSFEGVEVVEGTHIATILEPWNEAVANQEDLEPIVSEITGLNDERTGDEGRFETRSGETYAYSLVPLPDGQTMLTLANVTASVKFENALRERAEALEESDRLKSRFIQHVSYELRAPLTNISGFGELLEASQIGSLNEKQAEYLGHINYSAGVLRALVDDILDLASIDAGTMVLDREELELTPVIDQSLASFDALFSEKGIKTKIDVAEESNRIIADRDRLVQILHNLLSNAINASPDGSKITIEAKVEDDMHVLSISDEGSGVPEGMEETIFNRFEAVSAQGRRQGAGLGLSIVKGFVELHGGSVRTESAGKRGACFVCRFPQNPPLPQEEMPEYSESETAAA